MQELRPYLVVIAGPNGAGKTSTAPRLLRGFLGLDQFVNADTIAQGLSTFAPETVSIGAGRIMVERLRELAHQRANFAFETTLATRSFLLWFRELQAGGYSIYLSFLSVATVEIAIARVENRVRLGGHAVPENVIRRRYARGLGNFFRRYRWTVDGWSFYDNSTPVGPRLIARAVERGVEPQILDNRYWSRLQERFG